MRGLTLLLVVIIFSISNLVSYAAPIKGIILDRTTKEPIPYANLDVLHTKYATTSNEKGAFELNAPNKKSLSIRISCIAYKTLELKLSELTEVIYLEKHTYDLQEVIVSDNKPSAQDFIAKAYSKVKENYIVGDHLLTGYFKEAEYDQDSPIYTAESIIENKLPTSNDLYFSIKTRYFDKRKKVYKDLAPYKLKVKKGGAWRCVKYSMIDPINAMSPAHFEEYDYEIKGFENYKGRRVVVISFGNDTRLPVYGLFFIDLETYAFIRLEGNQLHGDGGPFDNWKWKHHKWIEEYQANEEGRYYLEGSLYLGNWINKRSKKEYEFRSSFVTEDLAYQKDLSTGGSIITRKESLFESIPESKEDLLENRDVQLIRQMEKRLHQGLPKYSSFKRPYKR